MSLPSVRPWLVGVVAGAIASAIAISILATVAWDPSVFVGFGEDAVPTRAFGEAHLGDVLLRPAQGHDGKYFFIQATDPWLLHPEENAVNLGRPLYRSQRMLYPTIAGGGGLLENWAIVWSLLIVNIVALGAGTWAAATIAVDLGANALWGLSFGLNIGFIYEMKVDGAGIVAAALAFGAVVYLSRGATAPGIVLLALAALTREVMLVAAAGAAVWLAAIARRRWAASGALLIPAAAVAGWAFYVRLRIPHDAGSTEVREIGAPFVGIIRAFDGWLERPLDLAIGIGILALLVVYGWRLSRSRELVGWTFAGFIPLAILLTSRVWEHNFDSTRAVAPALTALVLMFVARRPAPEGPTGDSTARRRPRALS